MFRAGRLQRSLIVLGTACVAVYIAQHLIATINIDQVHFFGPSFILWLGLPGFVLLFLGLAMAVFRTPRWYKALPILGILVGLPTLLAAILIAELIGRYPYELDRSTLPDGDVAMLGFHPGPPEPRLRVWRSAGLGWRPLGNYVDLSRRNLPEKPDLVLSENGASLMVRSGKVLIDCLNIVDGGPGPCR